MSAEPVQLTWFGVSEKTSRRSNRISRSVGRQRRADQSAVNVGPQDTVINVHEGRSWLEIEATTYAALRAKTGDAIVCAFLFSVDEGPPERRQVVGVLGNVFTRNRRRICPVWLTQEIDLDSLESVTLRRYRPA